MAPEGRRSILLRDPGEEETAVPVLRGLPRACVLARAGRRVGARGRRAGPARAPTLVYGIGLCALFAISGLYVGGVALAALPQLLDRLGAAPLVLLGLGALLYCLGAGVYAFKRPEPWPRTFGFHEVFHGLVILAAASHSIALAGWVIPSAA